MKEILRIEKLNKIFHEPEDFQVLKDISFSINKGEFVTITGKSGCGKSTLLYLLSTLDTEYDGKIFINDTLITGSSQNELARFRNKSIGFVFQFHFLLPEFTALQNVMIPALRLGKYNEKEIKDRAYEKLKQMGMETFAEKLSSKLSGGQQQRVAIARALINEPALIMADEPTGNLDTANTQNVFDIFKELTSVNGQTIIAVSHDEDFARNSGRIIHMVDGQIETN